MTAAGHADGGDGARRTDGGDRAPGTGRTPAGAAGTGDRRHAGTERGEAGRPGNGGNGSTGNAGARQGATRSGRRRAREFALQGLYQWLLSGEDRGAIQAQLARNPDFGRADQAHFESLLNGAIAQTEDLHALITPHLDRPAVQLSPVEHAVLMLCTCEMVNHLEIPYRVIINEGVELTKSFGGTDGYRYVNGVLDRVAGTVRPDEVRASGRRPHRQPERG